MREVMSKVIRFRNESGWEISDTQNVIVKSIYIEACELLVNFKDGCESKENIIEELADVLIYTVTLLNDLEIDYEYLIKRYY